MICGSRSPRKEQKLAGKDDKDRFIRQGDKALAEYSERTGLWHIYGRGSKSESWQLLDKFEGSRAEAVVYLPVALERLKTE